MRDAEEHRRPTRAERKLIREQRQAEDGDRVRVKA